MMSWKVRETGSLGITYHHSSYKESFNHQPCFLFLEVLEDQKNTACHVTKR